MRVATGLYEILLLILFPSHASKTKSNQNCTKKEPSNILDSITGK